MTHERDDHLPLFRSPLVDNEALELGTLHNNQDLRPHSATRSEGESERSGSQEPITKSLKQNSKRRLFRQSSETTHAELFYDLFFVANLTVFTTVHEVNDKTTLDQYIGFFAVLWLTWYQVSLYDVRFSTDSVVDRLAKALQSGVMIGFAVVGPDFNVLTRSQQKAQKLESQALTAFKSLSLILMVSRFIICLQYIQVIAFARKQHRETVLPLAASAATYAIAAVIYFGLYFNFRENSSNQGFIGWYIVALSESLAVTAISSYWRVISFKHTHLIERMSLLTLIFIGEGVIGAARSTSELLRSEVFGPTPAILGNVVALVLILYFLYMLYFDWVEEDHIGSIRQQIWAFLHFPLHLALVVAVEGADQVLKWTAGVDAIGRLYEQFENFDLNATSEAIAGSVEELNKTATAIALEAFSVVSSTDLTEVNAFSQQVDVIVTNVDTLANVSDTVDNRSDAAGVLLDILVEQILTAAEFSPPRRHTQGNTTDTSIDDEVYAASGAIYRVFALVFVYFFIAIGLVIIMITVIAALSKIGKRSLHWVRLGINLAIGAGLCFLSAIVRTSYTNADADAYDNYIQSAWILPTVTLALFVTVLVNNVDFLRCGSLRRSGHRGRVQERGRQTQVRRLP